MTFHRLRYVQAHFTRTHDSRVYGWGDVCADHHRGCACSAATRSLQAEAVAPVSRHRDGVGSAAGAQPSSKSARWNGGQWRHWRRFCWRPGLLHRPIPAPWSYHDAEQTMIKSSALSGVWAKVLWPPFESVGGLKGCASIAGCLSIIMLLTWGLFKSLADPSITGKKRLKLNRNQSLSNPAM